MSLIATWFSEGRRAQHPLVPRRPLGIFRWRVLDQQYGAPCVARPARRYPGRPDRHRRHLQGRPADAVARQFRAAGRDLRRTGCRVRVGDAAVQYDNLDGASRSISRTRVILLNLFSTQRDAGGPLRPSTAVGWNERQGRSHAPEKPGSDATPVNGEAMPDASAGDSHRARDRGCGRGKSKSGIDAALDICRPGSL
jgi:hypothetical protein